MGKFRDKTVATKSQIKKISRTPIWNNLLWNKNRKSARSPFRETNAANSFSCFTFIHIHLSSSLLCVYFNKCRIIQDGTNIEIMAHPFAISLPEYLVKFDDEVYKISTFLAVSYFKNDWFARCRSFTLLPKLASERESLTTLPVSWESAVDECTIPRVTGQTSTSAFLCG